MQKVTLEYLFLPSGRCRSGTVDERGRMLSMLWLPGLKINFRSLNKTLTVQRATVDKQVQNQIYPSLKRVVERREWKNPIKRGIEESEELYVLKLVHSR